MIRRIRLKNFESHRNTELVFSNGINIISGQSNHGKSSIIRALWWIKDNKPSGSSMISFWNRDKKGNPDKKTFCEIETASKSGSHIIRREKSPDLNGYVLDGQKLEAVGQGSPDEIKDLLKLDDINIQYQLDRPFMLDESSAEVARIFNRVIRLDVIDRVQTKADLYRKRTESKISELNNNLSALKEKYESLSWLDEAENIYAKYQNISDELFGYRNNSAVLSKIISDAKNYQDIINRANQYSKAKDIIDAIDAILADREKQMANYSKILNIITGIKACRDTIVKCAKALEYENIFIKIDSLHEEYLYLTTKLKTIKMLVEEHTKNAKAIDIYVSEHNKLAAKMPKVCPLCGSKL